MRVILNIILLSALLFGMSPAQAQNGDTVAFSITPPLIKNSMSPGEVWKSSVKLVNNNSKELTVYLQTANFQGKEEGGAVEFLEYVSLNSMADKASPYLSHWIVLESNELVIPAYGSKEIPFIIDVPDNASPGGHYAAILAGTRPPADSAGGAEIKISSQITSLLLLSIKGEIEERGNIREFSSNKEFYDQPAVDFAVRFENMGNVHLQPQGEIRVYAPFDKLKETIAINRGSEFGNVLPQSIRKWDFHWSSEKNILEMGRYRAELILEFGENERETIAQTVYFWVVYVKVLLIGLASLLFGIFLLVFFIRLSIRRAIKATTGAMGVEPSAYAISREARPVVKAKPVIRGTEEEVIDLTRKEKK